MARLIYDTDAKERIEQLYLDPETYRDRADYVAAYNDAIRNALDALGDSPTFERGPHPAATRAAERKKTRLGKKYVNERTNEAWNYLIDSLERLAPSLLKEDLLEDFETIYMADVVCMDIYGENRNGLQVGSKFKKRIFMDAVMDDVE